MTGTTTIFRRVVDTQAINNGFNAILIENMGTSTALFNDKPIPAGAVFGYSLGINEIDVGNYNITFRGPGVNEVWVTQIRYQKNIIEPIPVTQS